MKTPGLVLLLLWAGLDVVAGASKDIQDQTVLREVSPLIAELTQELRYSKIQMEAMETRLKQVEANAKTLNLMESKMMELRMRSEECLVSFSTSLATTGVVNLGPSPKAIPIVFKNVITNVGNAYNPDTGLFTAPLKGVYHFLVFIVGFGSPDRMTSAYIQKNGKQVVIASGHQPQARVDTSNAVSLLLEEGDVVNVMLWPTSSVHDSHNHHTTFTGHLLFPIWEE